MRARSRKAYRSTKSGWRTWCRRSLSGAFGLLLIMPVSALADDEREEGNGLTISTLSGTADRVSGGDALVEITFQRGDHLTIRLNGQDVSSAFHPGPAPNSLVGLVTGLVLGRNTLTVEGRRARRTLHLTNYPIKGPIVSGPHIHPFICQTESFHLPDDTTLGPPIDSDCSVETQVNYVYKSTEDGTFRPLPDPTVLPPDVARTTNSEGVTVWYVVRVETGTMNRGIYQNAILHDPTSDPPPSPFSPPAGWNRKLIAIHGAGCPGGWYTQGSQEGVNVLSDMYLSQGYALFINTLQNPSNSCNPFVAGESAMMGKEHFIKTFGVPFFTISTGGSGGAYTSLQVADAFPGLIDGIFINATFPDAAEIAYSGLDGHLLTHYFTVTNPDGFTIDEQVAVSGYQGRQAWYDAANQAQRTDPVPGRIDVEGYNSAVWNAVVPMELRYHPVTNPRGARPTVFDVSRNIYGMDPNTGFALRAFDNVGVQYGLKALNEGVISTTQFLDLNEGIGGYDDDANYIASRAVGNRGAIRRAYQSGVNLGGGGGLTAIPIIDFGFYNEAAAYHYQWHHFAVRQRLIEANGSAENHILWRGDDATSVPLNHAFAVMTQWVTAIKNDHSHIPLRQKVIRNRPAEARDGCYDANVPPQFIAEPQTWSSEPDSQCNTLWPSYSFPRKVAGGPLSASILKCQLKPIDPRDYAVSFTRAELERLRGIFPNGVCDWSRRGVNQVPVAVGISFGPAPSHRHEGEGEDDSGD
jgi:uncharacterized tannase-like protein DUF6351